MAGIESTALNIGGVPRTPHEWVRKLVVDCGLRDGVSGEERDCIKALDREDMELLRATEILKLASFFLPRRNSTTNSRREVSVRPTPS